MPADDDGTAGLSGEGGGLRSEWVCVFHLLRFPPLDDSIEPHDRRQRRGLIFFIPPRFSSRRLPTRPSLSQYKSQYLRFPREMKDVSDQSVKISA